jgi:CheY-like chemotaxis protein
MVTEVMLENNDSGFNLAKNAKDKYPEMPIVILSDVVRQTGILFELDSADEKVWIKADKFINKPVNPAKLACSIKKLLG